MAAPLTVACALVGDKWDEVWVHRLERMVEEHCSVPHRFVCISDREVMGVETIPLTREVVWTDEPPSQNDRRLILDRNKPQGCWAKTDIFDQLKHLMILYWSYCF